MRPAPSHPLALAFGAAALLSFSALPALAEPTPKEWSEWKQLTESGKKAMREGRVGAAVEAFRRADKIHKSPTLDVDLAAALVVAGKLVEAEKLLLAVTETKDPGIVHKRARDAAKKALGDLGPKVPRLRITVSGAAGAQVTVDGASASVGAEIKVDPGEHVVRATADGAIAAEKTLTLAEGKVESVMLSLAPAAPSAAEVPAEKGGGSRVPGIVVLSVGGAGLAVGAVFGGLAFGAASSAKSLCSGTSCPPSAQSEIDRSKAMGNVSTGLFIGGGVVAAVGVVLTILAPGGRAKADEAPKDKPSASLQPFVGPGTMGLHGRF
jgi:hypothetical protein